MDSWPERRGFNSEANPGIPLWDPEFRRCRGGAAAPRYTGCPVRREAAGGGIALPAVHRGGGPDAQRGPRRGTGAVVRVRRTARTCPWRPPADAWPRKPAASRC
ncbi:hypothetical protein GCM10020254_24590 [Streptomyces goshikiensis]